MQRQAATVAITGAAGVIAQSVRKGLERAGYTVIGIDRSIPRAQGGPGVDPESCLDHSAVDRVCDFSDASQCEGIFDGCTHVLHLAGQGDPSSEFIDDILPNNIVGMYNCCEAAVAAGVKKFVFASTNHTQAGGTLDLSKGRDSVDMDRLQAFSSLDGNTLQHGAVNLHHSLGNSSACPDSFYGCSKLFGESLGSYYSIVQGKFDFVALRIGWCLYDDPTVLKGTKYEDYLRSIFLSRRDCLGYVKAALEVDAHANGREGCIIAYAVSDNSRTPMFDINESVQLLGYKPVDDSEKFNWE